MKQQKNMDHREKNVLEKKYSSESWGEKGRMIPENRKMSFLIFFAFRENFMKLINSYFIRILKYSYESKHTGTTSDKITW